MDRLFMLEKQYTSYATMHLVHDKISFTFDPKPSKICAENTENLAGVEESYATYTPRGSRLIKAQVPRSRPRDIEWTSTRNSNSKVFGCGLARI